MLQILYRHTNIFNGKGYENRVQEFSTNKLLIILVYNKLALQ